MVDQSKLDEYQKCMSPYYFFTTYIRVNNEPAHTFLTEEEFNLIFSQLVKNGK